MTYKKMSYISGLIVFFSMVIFFGSILWLSGQQILFSKKYIVYFKFSDVVGLRDRSPVYMRGYRVGWTKDVFFEENGVRVRVDIKNKFRIPIDSKIEINTLNLIGEKAVTIEPGNSTTYLKPNGILKGQNRDIMIIAKKILIAAKDKFESGELDVRIEDLGKTIDSFIQLIRTVNRSLEKVDIDMYNRQIATVGEAGKELRNFLQEAKIDTHQLVTDSRLTLEKIDNAIAQLTDTSREIKTISQKINEGQGTAGELLHSKELINNINQTIKELNQFLTDIKKNPKKYVRFSIF